MSHSLDFQSIILRLLNYWAEQGCLIWQPYHTEVGAGTNNPATYLRVLGPEPWNVAYVEPSIRPDDGRYGENPNRFYQHYQMQVILKPDPGNPQELYLRSLEALGIDPRAHDMRFVEDNWESPALGAWGLGWEVWLDGQEITQFTYFQQAGGQTLDPPSVEITYGLERIAMALQKVRDFRGLRWNDQFTYGDVNLQSEQEFSKYSFEIGDVDRLRQLFSIYSAEAEAALNNGLVLPAHDYVLKCSHTFNLLDTRGAVGVTERQGLFGKMRDFSRRVAQLYLEKRQQLEFPWLEKPLHIAGGSNKTGAPAVIPAASPAVLPGLPKIDQAAPFLLEIGTEELPAADLESAITQLRQRVPEVLKSLRLGHGEVKVWGTPRRVVVWVEDLTSQQADLEQVVKGPPAERAYDAEGQPTKAAEGFARSRGVEVGDLEVKEMDGGRYITAVVRQAGRAAAGVLMEMLPELTAGIRFDKSMRWNQSNVAFSRPVRWLLALYAGEVIPFEYGGLIAGRSTRGLRFYQPEEISVKDGKSYFELLSGQGILLDPEERSKAITKQVAELAIKVNAQTPDEPDLLDEVTNLVEAPTALLGKFEESFLDLPVEVLISVMKKHQRYFPLRRKDEPEKLLPYFITVRNGDEQHLDSVASGNEDVIRARFADASYFIRADRKLPLEAYVERLSTLTFQKDLGSMLDKTKRLEQLVEDLAPVVGLTEEDAETAKRAAKLSKADLATQMVIEMTSLQGVMGRYYALEAGETMETATAIFEHNLPRYAGDNLPKTRPGLLLGLADRLDTLSGLFAVGLAPTGAKDPFALRRAALGLVQALLAWDLDFDLRQGLRVAAERLPVRFNADEQKACLSFIIERLRNLLLEQGYRYDVVDAVLAQQGHNPAGAGKAVKELTTWVERADWNTILPAFARCVRITRDLTERYMISPEALVEDEEKTLFEKIKTASVEERKSGSMENFFTVFQPLIPAINRFFDKVLVMAENPALRTNRLGMLQVIAGMADGVADFSRLEGF